MPRHTPLRDKGRLARPVVVGLFVVPVLLAGGLVWWLVAGKDGGDDGGNDVGCTTRQTVAVTAAPEVAPVARDVLADPIDLGDGACAVARVSAQEPLQTVGDLGALDADALPRVWVPDSSLWTGRADDVPV